MRFFLSVVALLCMLPSQGLADVILRPRAEGALTEFAAVRPNMLPGLAQWTEAQLKLGVGIQLEPRWVLELRGALGATISDDLTGLPDRYSLRLDRASLLVETAFVDVIVGRQALSFGHGFLIADGQNEWGMAIAGQEAGVTAPGGARFTSAYDDFDALRIATSNQRLQLDWILANINPTYRYAYEGQATDVAYSEGLMSALDVQGRLSWGTLGFTELACFTGGDLRSTSALRADVLPGRQWSGRVEIAAQGGVQGDILQLSQAAYAMVKRQWNYHPSEPHVGLAAYFFSGDHPQTELDEAFVPQFSEQQLWSPFVLGEIVGRRHLLNSDLIVGRLDGEISVQEDHRLGARLYGHLTHRGTAICRQKTGEAYCVEEEDERLGTVGVKDFLTAELDLYYQLVRPTALIDSRYTAVLGLVQPFKAASQPLFQDPESNPVLGVSAAVQLMVNAEGFF